MSINEGTTDGIVIDGLIDRLEDARPDSFKAKRSYSFTGDNEEV